ncbi:MAG: hypothetical protein GX070_09110 [Alcaligenaceae bacterium]|nr:hypothetical protein [Alcaligenaceae bacterium]
MQNYSEATARQLANLEKREARLENIVAPFAAVVSSVYTAVLFFADMFKDAKETIADVEETNGHVGGYWL